VDALDALDAKKHIHSSWGIFLMTATALLDELRTKGVHLTVEGQHVAVDAPKGVLTDALRQAIRQHKHALLAMLRQAPPALLSDIPVYTPAFQPVTAPEVRPLVQAQRSPRAPSAQPHAPVWCCRHCGAVVPIAGLHWGYCDAPACDSARQACEYASWPWLQREPRAAGGGDKA
jgi:hypothetical protein